MYQTVCNNIGMCEILKECAPSFVTYIIIIIIILFYFIIRPQLSTTEHRPPLERTIPVLGPMAAGADES